MAKANLFGDNPTANLLGYSALTAAGGGALWSSITHILQDAKKRKRQELLGTARKDVKDIYRSMNVPIKTDFDEGDETVPSAKTANSVLHHIIGWPAAALLGYGAYAGARGATSKVLSPFKPKFNTESPAVVDARQQYEDALRELATYDEDEETDEPMDMSKVGSGEPYSQEHLKQALHRLYKFAMQEGEAVTNMTKPLTKQADDILGIGAAAGSLGNSLKDLAIPLVGGGLTIASLPLILGMERARKDSKRRESEAMQAARAWQLQRSARDVDVTPLRAEKAE